MLQNEDDARNSRVRKTCIMRENVRERISEENVSYRIEPISEDMQWWGKYGDSKEGWERGRTNQCIKLYGNCASMTTRLSELSMRISNGNIERESDPLLLISQVPWVELHSKDEPSLHHLEHGPTWCELVLLYEHETYESIRPRCKRTEVAAWISA